MKLVDFMVAMSRAEARASTTGLTAADLTMIRDAGRAWHNDERPAEGALAVAWTEGQRVFAISEARELELFREQRLRELEINRLEREVAVLYEELDASEAAQKKAAKKRARLSPADYQLGVA